MMKSSDELNKKEGKKIKTTKLCVKIMKMHRIKIIIIQVFFTEKFAKNCIPNIKDKEKKLWLRKKDIGEKLDVENMYGLYSYE